MSPRWQPLAWYLGVALGLPVLRGAPLDAAFAEHAVTMLAVSSALTAAWWGLRRRSSARHKVDANADFKRRRGSDVAQAPAPVPLGRYPLSTHAYRLFLQSTKCWTDT